MPACARREYPSNDRRLAAILAADVVGYSRLTGGTARAVREHYERSPSDNVQRE
jgi:class 3 adenylate cyclase